MRSILRWVLVLFLLAVAGFLFYVFGSFDTSSDHQLAVKHTSDGSTLSLRCTRIITHRSGFIWGLPGRERLQYYVVTNKGVRSEFTHNELGGIEDAQYASIPGTEKWIGAYIGLGAELVIYIFDGSGKILDLEKLALMSRRDRKNLKSPVFKILESDNCVIYMSPEGYMKYNYVDKTKSHYEGTLE